MPSQTNMPKMSSEHSVCAHLVQHWGLTAPQALLAYENARTTGWSTGSTDSQGVTGASQIRYVHYYAQILKEGRERELDDPPPALLYEPLIRLARGGQLARALRVRDESRPLLLHRGFRPVLHIRLAAQVRHERGRVALVRAPRLHCEILLLVVSALQPGQLLAQLGSLAHRALALGLERLYEAAAAEEQAADAEASTPNDDEVVDAEIIEDDAEEAS